MNPSVLEKNRIPPGLLASPLPHTSPQQERAALSRPLKRTGPSPAPRRQERATPATFPELEDLIRFDKIQCPQTIKSC